jgi:hypothetical protein
MTMAGAGEAAKWMIGSEGLVAGLTGIATALGIVAAAAGAVAIAYKAWYDLSPEG